jgi:hypothetical protein
MNEKDRVIYLKALMNQPDKTAQDYARLGRAYEKHVQILKEEAKKRIEEVKNAVDVFSTNLL